SENRTNKHSYNWFSIVKNTTYFVARFSCLSEENLEAYLNDRIQKERVQPLEAAVESGELSVKERDQFVNQIWQGVQQGLKDAARGPLTRQIKPRPGAFMPFPIDSEAPRIGVDLPQLHICIVSKEFPPFGASGGIGTLYSHLTGELLILGHEVTVILPRQEEGRDDQGRFHIKYVRPDEVGFDGTVPANAANLSWSLRAAAAVAEVHQERPVHVVETALWDAEGLAFALIQQGRRPPIVVRLVTPFAVASAMNEWDMPPSATEQFVAAERALISHADAVIAISESVAATVEKEYQLERDDRWKISHCGIAYWPFFDVNTGYAEFTGLETIGSQIQKFGKLVLFVGRLERRKGIDTFLEAVAGILSANSDTCIVIAGKDIEGWTQKSEAIIPAKYKKRVIFAGNVSDLLREKLMAQADCVVFPSRYESFGLVPLEAFVHGVPVIAADAGAIPEVVEDGESGLLFPAEDARILAKTVTRLLQDRDLRERLSHGAKRASRRFSGRNAALESIEIYRSVVR
ncbi:MAG TPA: glycosyltransferase family 4 protein, partial [Nitrospiraceae bacterium]|nr:glycosyltransferase family 4 protein [Nitrospiraceae bacterium]